MSSLQEMGIGVEKLTICRQCGQQLENPMLLPCSHVFCKSCLHAFNKAGKLECPSCKTVHQVNNGDLDRTFKPSVLTTFWVNLFNQHFDHMRIEENERVETEGVCEACAPPVSGKGAAKKSVGNKDQVAPEPVKVKLAVCFHCEKKICDACRTKHYTQQRQEAVKVADEYQTNTGNIAILCEKINESRAKKLVEYDKMKLDVTARKQELVRALELEEKTLLAKIDEEIALEKTRIQSSENDSKRLASCREAVKTVKQRIASLTEDPSDTNVKKINAMCKDLMSTQDEWRGILSGEATRNDPTKEKRIYFIRSKIKDDLVGTIDTKKENLNLKAAKMPPKDGEKSKICTIS